jgi:phospholipid transport system substrate-binding protein
MLRTALAPLTTFFLLLMALPAAQAASAPADTVSAFHQALSEAMARSAKLGCEGRIAKLGPAVDAAFDLPFIAERSLRRHWKNLDESQRQQFTAALRTSVVATYATEFSTPGSVTFSTGATEPQSNGDALVRASLKPKDDAAVSLDYLLKPRGEHWQVVNVLADGVSDLALRASQYDGLMKKEGLPALLARLDSQTQQLLSRCK